MASLEADEESAKKMTEARQWLAEGLDEDLRSLRLKIGLSQAQLAKSVGLRQPNISAIEAGKRKPEYETAQRLALVLNTTPDKIYALWNNIKEA
jgi:transcriptional regulator with XRE-family HTH domain